MIAHHAEPESIVIQYKNSSNRNRKEDGGGGNLWQRACATRLERCLQLSQRRHRVVVPHGHHPDGCRPWHSQPNHAGFVLCKKKWKSRGDKLSAKQTMSR
jgi:hypothetical protein